MASGTRDLGMTFTARIVMICIGLGIQSCLAWFLGPAGRGSYAVCLIFATLLRVVFVIGCDKAILYFVSSKRFDISQGIINATIYGTIGSVLAILTGLILMQLPLSFFDKATPTAFYLALFLIPTSLYSIIFMFLLTSVREFGWFAIVSIIYGLAKLLFTLFFVCVCSWGVNGALIAVIASDILAIIITIFFFKWKYGFKIVSPAIADLQEVLHYGVRQQAGKISNQTNVMAGTIILAFFVDKNDLGLFAVASGLTFQVTAIPDVISTVLIPRVAGDEVGKKELVAQCFRLTAIVCGVLLLILAVFAKPIVTVLFSTKFLDAVLFIRILSIGVALRCACKIFEPYLLGTNHPGSTSISVVVGTIVNLIVLWFLLPVVGLPAAALGIMVGFFVSSSLLIMFFVSYSGLGLRQTIQLGQTDWIFVSNTVKQFRRKILNIYQLSRSRL